MQRGPTPLELCLSEASRLSFSSTPAEVRLGVILADNAVELLLLGKAEDFIFHDRWSTEPDWDYDRRVQVHSTFEAKVVAAVEQGWIDRTQAEVARTGHYIRNGAYHTGEAGGGDRIAAAWCPHVLHLAFQLATRDGRPLQAVPHTGAAEPITAVLELCASTVADRVDQVVHGLHEYGTACTGPLPDDDELDEILAGAEAAWGVGFIETSPGRKKDEVKAMLRAHVFDGSSLPRRQLTVSQLRTWQAEAAAHRGSPVLSAVAPWWRTVDRRLSVYEKTIELANL